ncbi:hypothetical protein VTJ49DRAFT_1408 [Mycothermus thermophilus]|uniref:Thymidylate kinase n=1 Tax=Humicola insolens TaxID=85995 RepID=A0ABR3VD36_HUMIN
MATLARQPFAPVDGARLKSLASVKNRQNALASSPGKRKASEVGDVDNSENIAPVLFPKRSKGADLWGDLNGFVKPSNFTLKTTSSSVLKDVISPASNISAVSQPRAILEPKSPAARLKAKATAVSPSPRSSPAGRSPPRATKRMGILSRRRISRPDPPSFSSASIPFSLDAALKGTIPSYSGSLRTSKAKAKPSTSTTSSSAPVDFFFSTPDPKSSLWCFDIHEDTPEQEMTNLLQHSTCTLDISSDEESESRAKRDRAEGRDKENIPPPEDVSQTSLARGGPSSSRGTDAVDIDEDVLLMKGRGPLAEMNVTDFYAQGVDSSSVFIIPGDEEDPEAVVGEAEAAAKAAAEAELAALSELPPLPEDGEEERGWFATEEDSHAEQPYVSLADVDSVDVDDIMGDGGQSILEANPVEAGDENFEIWESNSAKEAASVPASPGPLVDDDVASQGDASDVL